MASSSRRWMPPCLQDDQHQPRSAREFKWVLQYSSSISCFSSIQQWQGFRGNYPGFFVAILETWSIGKSLDFDFDWIKGLSLEIPSGSRIKPWMILEGTGFFTTNSGLDTAEDNRLLSRRKQSWILLKIKGFFKTYTILDAIEENSLFTTKSGLHTIKKTGSSRFHVLELKNWVWRIIKPIISLIVDGCRYLAVAACFLLHQEKWCLFLCYCCFPILVIRNLHCLVSSESRLLQLLCPWSLIDAGISHILLASRF